MSVRRKASTPESVRRGARVQSRAGGDKPINQSNVRRSKKTRSICNRYRPLPPATARYRLLPPVTASAFRPNEYRAARTQITRVLHGYTLGSGIYFQRFDIEWVDEVIEAESTASRAAGLQQDTVENDAGVTFSAKEHRVRGSHGDCTLQAGTALCRAPLLSPASDAHSRHPMK